MRDEIAAGVFAGYWDGEALIEAPQKGLVKRSDVVGGSKHDDVRWFAVSLSRATTRGVARSLRSQVVELQQQLAQQSARSSVVTVAICTARSGNSVDLVEEHAGRREGAGQAEY